MPKVVHTTTVQGFHTSHAANLRNVCTEEFSNAPHPRAANRAAKRRDTLPGRVSGILRSPLAAPLWLLLRRRRLRARAHGLRPLGPLGVIQRLKLAGPLARLEMITTCLTRLLVEVGVARVMVEVEVIQVEVEVIEISSDDDYVIDLT